MILQQASISPATKFDPTWVRTLLAKLAGVRGAVAALGLLGAVLSSPSHAQAPPLGTLMGLGGFGVLAGSTVTNTGPTVISGTALNTANVGVSPGAAVVGFPPGIVVPPGVIHAADAAALQAQSDLTIAFNNLAGKPTSVNLTGQDLGGLTLVPGVYNFASSAQLTGTPHA